MTEQPKIKNNVCLNVDPAGCREEALRMIAREKAQAPVQNGPKRVLVIGCSTGYGLATRITAAFGGGADTVGVSFERPETERRNGTPGWYNNRVFEEEARKAGLQAHTFEGDAFSDEMKAETASWIKQNLGDVDMVVYSLASGVRKDPETECTYRSVLKPIGQSFTGRAVDIITGKIEEVETEPATEEEIAATVKVMGGGDWRRWISHLKEAGVLAPGCFTMAYSYIGPEITRPLYRDGTIGRAKEDLESTAALIRADLAELDGDAFVSINKALVTRASSVIPAMALYIAVLAKVMKERHLHEGCEEQIDRLFRDRLAGKLGSRTQSAAIETDEEGRIRIDDWEMRDDIQAEVSRLMVEITEENLTEQSDWDGFRRDFLAIHGFKDF